MIYKRMNMEDFEKQLSVRLRKEIEALVPPAGMLEEVQRRLLAVAQEDDSSVISWTVLSATSAPDILCQFQAVHCHVI
jgi:hypothetical protein